MSMTSVVFQNVLVADREEETALTVLGHVVERSIVGTLASVAE